MAEGPRQSAYDRVRDLLYMAATRREVEKHKVGSAAHRMALQVADAARSRYHEAVDEVQHPHEADETEHTG